MMVDLTGRFLWMTNYSKKQWRKLFWRIRASLKKAFKSNGGRVRLLRRGGSGGLNFQYDPSSYALNFDDGLWSKAGGIDQVQKKQEEEPNDNNNVFRVVKLVRHQQLSPVDSDNTTTWVYVFWVKI